MYCNVRLEAASAYHESPRTVCVRVRVRACVCACASHVLGDCPFLVGFQLLQIMTATSTSIAALIPPVNKIRQKKEWYVPHTLSPDLQ